MRCVSLLWIVCLLVGCRSQAVPVTNPFMGPTVVPAPSTRAPAPGMATPYYPGEAVPSSAPPASPPPVTPGGTYGVPPASQTPATQPPGGWNNYPSTSQLNSGDVQPVSASFNLGPQESVSVPTDDGSLRFAQNHADGFEPVTPTAPAPVSPNNNVTPVQFVDQTPTPVDQRSVTIREISSQQAEDYQSRPSGQDGFRPQGSSRSAREQNRFSEPVEEASTATLEARPVAPTKEVADRFGYDPQYGWLRGTLEQSPTTGQWNLRYVPQQGQADQFGGTLSIANPQVLGNLQNGEYVAVQGQLQMLQLGTGANVPTYSISVLQRQQFDVQ